MARLSTGPEADVTTWRTQLEQQQHAKESDDDEDESDDDEDESDDDEDESDDDDLDEDEAKAELKRIRAALKDANAQGAKRRTSVKTLKTRLAKAERDLTASRVAKPKSGDDTADVDVEAVKAATKLEADAAAEAKIKRAEARGALRGAGVGSDLLDKAVRTLDLEDLDVDDDGNVDGLDEAIAELRASVPSLFGAKAAARRRSVAGPSDRDGERGPKAKKLTTSEIQAKQIRGELR